MKSLYTNLSPLTNAYTIFHHLFLVKEKKPQRLLLCVWDLYFFEDKRFLASDNPQEQLKQNVANIEKVLKYLKIDYKLFYLSQAWERFFARQDLVKLHRKILSTITFNDLKKKSEFAYSMFGETSLSRMEYMVVDFLIATHFHELFPEYAASAPTEYFTSERFKVFQDHIVDTLASNYRKTKSPIVEYATSIPLILDDEGRLPSIDMPETTIAAIVEASLKKQKVTEKLLDDWTPLFKSVQLELTKDDREHILKGNTNAFKTLFLSYLNALKHIVEKGDKKESVPSLFITSTQSFEDKVKPLNDLKLKILSLCDGSRTSYEIAKLLTLKPVTVSVYFGRLKEMGLLSEGRRPKLLVRNIVIDIPSLKA